MSDRDENIPKRFDVVRKIDRGNSVYWAPVGTISLWQRKKDGVLVVSGKCLINVFGEEFHVFEAKPRETSSDNKSSQNAKPTPAGHPVYKGETDDIPF